MATMWGTEDFRLEPNRTDSVDRAELWSKYKQEQQWMKVFEEDGEHVILDPATNPMTFYTKTIGDKPVGGYPLYITLHGGGGCPKMVNDEGYAHMKTYWVESVDTGVYIACRGITDTWKLHWEDASFYLYDLITEVAIAVKGVDSNRVYLMGYSAGGDGVYRIIPVMPDRFAAANMCAGHPNGVSVINMMQVPMLLQVGECDGAYNRNKITAEYGEKLVALNQSYPEFYKNKVLIHGGASHSRIKDWRQKGPVVANFTTWLGEGACEGASDYDSVVCDSVCWISKHKRNPTPHAIRWEPHQPKRVSRTGVHLHCLHFWLDISGGGAQGKYDSNMVEVTVDKQQNTVRVHRTGSWLKLLLDTRIIAIDRPLTVEIDAQSELPAATLTVMLDTSNASCARVMKRTLSERGDPEFMFEAECTLCFTGERWEATV